MTKKVSHPHPSQVPYVQGIHEGSLDQLDVANIKGTHLKEKEIPAVASQQRELPPTFNEPIKVEKVDESLSNQQMEEEVQNTEELIRQAQKLHDVPPKSAKEMTKEAKAKIRKELEYLKKQIQGPAEKIIKGLQVPPDLIHDFLIEPYGYFAEPFPFFTKEMKDTVATIMAPAIWTRDILQGIAFIGDGSALTFQSLFYHEVKKFLQKEKKHLAKNPEDKRLKLTVAKLEKYLSIQGEILKDKIVNFSSSFATIAIKGTNYVIGAMKDVAPLIKSGGGWAISFLDVITESVTLWRAHTAKTTHKSWMEEVAKDQRSKNDAFELLEKRKQRQDQRIQEKIKDLTFEELKEVLEEKGIDFQERKFTSLEDFKALLADKDFRKEIEEKFLGDEDAINVMTRNAMQALAEVKVKNEKKFFNFKLNASKLNLSLACLSTAVAITLEILAIAGVIAAAGSTLAVPGLGFFVLGIAIAAIGLYFFYKHKPNLFKCYVQGVNLRLAFFQIPTQIRNLQLIKKTAEVKKLTHTCSRYHELRGELEKKENLEKILNNKKYHRILEKFHKETLKKIHDYQDENEKVQKLLDKIKAREEKLNRRLEAQSKRQQVLEKKVESWIGEDGIVTKLQNRINEAGNRDFAVANRLITLARKNENGEAVKINIPLVIVEKFFEHHFDLDEETLKILQEKMGIKIRDIILDGKIDKEKLVKQLAIFFKMDDTELLSFMKQQLHNKAKAREAQAA